MASRVGHAHEVGGHERLEPGDGLGIDALREEGHVVGALVEERPEDRLEEVLGEVGVGGQVGEGDLRLDHPELREVPARVGVLGPEGRPEGVDLRHGQAVGLHVELPGDRQEGRLAEEVLPEVDRPVRARAAGWRGPAWRRGRARRRPRHRWP